MENSKMIFLATIAMISSFSITKTEFTPAEKLLLEKFAEQQLQHAIDSCHNSGVCPHHYDLFLMAIDQWPLDKIAPLISVYNDKMKEKAKRTSVNFCQGLSESLEHTLTGCNAKIAEGNGSLTYFELSIPAKDRLEASKKTISEILKNERETNANPALIERLELLENEGKGQLTQLQLYLQDEEDIVKFNLEIYAKENGLSNLMQSNK